MSPSAFPAAAYSTLWGLAVALLPAGAGAVELRTNTALATAGYYQLSWAADGPVELVESPDPAFSTSRLVYSGPDHATVLSGKRDGAWYYRARRNGDGAPGSWGPPVEVTVRHHSLNRALLFFVIGGMVFGMTVALIVRGSRSPA